MQESYIAHLSTTSQHLATTLAVVYYLSGFNGGTLLNVEQNCVLHSKINAKQPKYTKISEKDQNPSFL